MWHTHDSQGQILTVAFKEKPLKRFKMFRFRSQGINYSTREAHNLRAPSDRAGNDGAVKRYLAGELGKAKAHRDSLEAQVLLLFFVTLEPGVERYTSL